MKKEESRELSVAEVLKELKKEGISKHFFYKLIAEDEDVKKYIVVEGKMKKKYKVKAEYVNRLEKLIIKKWKEKNEFLTASSISRELKKKFGRSLSPSTIRYYLKYIPKNLVIEERKGKLTYYYFRPEAVNFFEKLFSRKYREQELI